jgi:hypothetical protein
VNLIAEVISGEPWDAIAKRGGKLKKGIPFERAKIVRYRLLRISGLE